jgi:hypothetical protein
MPSLRELQRGILRSLLEGEPQPDALAQIIAPPGMHPAPILNLYANNARSHFIDALRSSYPAVRRLVGDEYFDQCARSFHARYPSRSGDLQPAGEHFPEHLLELHGAGEYRYLGEVARLEWLIEETLLAADHAPLDLGKLQAVPPEGYDDLRFSLHPSARLFASEFPCTAIWEANVGSDAEPPTIDLGSGHDRVLLTRERGRLRLHRLSAGEMRFLRSLQAADTFRAAVESGFGAHLPGGAEEGLAATFDAAAALRRFVAATVIVDVG